MNTTVVTTNENTVNTTAEFSYNFNPNAFEWCLLVFAFTIFAIGIIGNLLVIIVVVKNAHMRTITNIFIVNLAIGDFLVILICLPPSVITDIAGSWWFGETMCKIIPYVQYISVCVSVMTLTSISYERYYAIVYPLKFQATKFRAKIILLVIWILAVLINLPHPIVITMQQENTTLYCYPTWNPIFQNILDMLIFVILYIVPMALIFYTYTRVVKVLWRIDKSIAWDESPSTPNPQVTTSSNNGGGDGSAAGSRRPSMTYSFPKKGGGGTAISSAATPTSVDMNIDTNGTGNTLKPPPTMYTMASGSSAAMSKIKNQLIARRKAAKMLISVAVLFAICYLPIHILNITRFIGSNMLENALGQYTVVLFQIAHCLVYVNSCVNPLIYNFMSDNFRKEFRKILFCNIVKSSPHSSEITELKGRYVNGVNNKRPSSGAMSNEYNFNRAPIAKHIQKSSSNHRLYQ